MKKMIMTLFARTPVHVGAGNSVGAVDSPIQRERHTRIPIIPGSSLKGVLADLWSEDMEKVKRGEKEVWVRKIGSAAESLFGQEENKNEGRKACSGSLLIGEARVLAFPVRSAKGMFAWITSPMVLKRYARDAGVSIDFDEKEITDKTCLAGGAVVYETNQVVLEEYVFEKGADAAAIAVVLKELMKENSLWQSVEEHLVVLSDTLFSYFVENACEVVTRIKISDETGTVDGSGLFNQEQVPSETLFYSVIAEQKIGSQQLDALEALQARLAKTGQLLQVGGDETIGLGFCDVEVK